MYRTYCHLHASIAWAVLTAAFFLAWPMHAQLGLGLSPMRIDVRGVPGGQNSGTLLLSNDVSDATRVRTELLDFYLDGNTTPQYDRQMAGETMYSCRTWLTINPMEIEVAGRAPVPVRYTIRIPNDAQVGSYHCAAGFVTLPTYKPDSAPMGMKMAVRMIASFYVVIGNPKIEAAFKELKLEPVQRGSESAWQAVLVFENLALMHTRPLGQLTVVDGTGAVVEVNEVPAVPLLPKRIQRVVLPLKTHFDNARYTLSVKVDLGTGEIQEGHLAVVPDKQ